MRLFSIFFKKHHPKQPLQNSVVVNKINDVSSSLQNSKFQCLTTALMVHGCIFFSIKWTWHHIKKIFQKFCKIFFTNFSYLLRCWVNRLNISRLGCGNSITSFRNCFNLSAASIITKNKMILTLAFKGLTLAHYWPMFSFYNLLKTTENQ